uniref:Odorant receptor n=1 Tax=Bradysia odoriphaga TaxID=1564500 RepID=A0A6B9CAD1_9DIPT|nr:odorant receptor 58 [Bradysia odoriphaga]
MENLKSIFRKLKEKIFKKKDEKHRTALDGMNGVMRFINSFAYIPGIQFTDDWKKNGRIGFACFVNLIVLLCTVYSVWYHYPAEFSVLVIGMFGFNAVVWVKLLVVVRNHDGFMSVVRFIYKMFKCNTSGRRERILSGVTKKMNYHLAINFFSFLAGYAFYSAFPLYDYIFNGKLTLVSPLVVPLIDWTNLRGYIITTDFNVFIVSYCLTVCIAVSSLFLAFVDAYDGMVSLIDEDFGAFSDMCNQNQCSKANDAVFRNLLVQLMDLARFSQYMNDLYSPISTAQVTMSFLVVVLSLAAYLAFDFISCIGGALVFFTEMLMYCFIGQLLDNTNERVVGVICNAKWYTYKVKYQKDMLVALYIAQNMHPISVANVSPLNFETGLNITSNIYTLTMFMIEIFD